MSVTTVGTLAMLKLSAHNLAILHQVSKPLQSIILIVKLHVYCLHIGFVSAKSAFYGYREGRKWIDQIFVMG